jgi:hypothetical protein
LDEAKKGGWPKKLKKEGCGELEERAKTLRDQVIEDLEKDLGRKPNDKEIAAELKRRAMDQAARTAEEPSLREGNWPIFDTMAPFETEREYDKATGAAADRGGLPPKHPATGARPRKTEPDEVDIIRRDNPKFGYRRALSPQEVDFANRMMPSLGGLNTLEVRQENIEELTDRVMEALLQEDEASDTQNMVQASVDAAIADPRTVDALKNAIRIALGELIGR